MNEVISVQSIITKDRMRKDFGNIDELANSIRTFGLIEPIILVNYKGEGYHFDQIRLIAGERRLKALSRIGLTELQHGVHFLWNGEQDSLRLKSMELEENIRRKSLNWDEEVLGKKQLLEIMQKIHGQPLMGRPTKAQQRAVKQGGKPLGFSIRSLSQMLGEPVTTTQHDLVVADAISKMPSLRASDSKEAVIRKMNITMTVAAMGLAAQVKAAQEVEATTEAITLGLPVPVPTKKWTLYEGDFEDNAKEVEYDSVDLIVTDLPYGAQVQGGPYHFADVTEFKSKTDSQSKVLQSLDRLCKESFRVLKPDRFCCLFFGFNFYGDLVNLLRKAGFKVDLVPIVWTKNTMSGENPHTHYRHSYEPILVARKGSPIFVRQGRKDVMPIPTVLPSNKMMAVEKPVQLLNEFLIDMTAPGATVLDWMAGTGSFGEAALKCPGGARNVILFERDKVACQMIKARLGSL